MFRFKEPASSKEPWILSKKSSTTRVTEIPLNLLKDLRNYDILGIEFLYQKYTEKFSGAILNEEDGFNMQLQVSVFLSVMFNCIDQQFRAVLLSPDNSILKWHYHLSVPGCFQLIIVGPETRPIDFDDKHGVILLVPFSNIKLVEPLTDYNFSSVVIDSFDAVAAKRIIRKLHSDFNIGLTSRSFYLNPDQKLQWTMLNWCNPGCVGKLLKFYEIDNDNFANFRDNYRHWWFRLTWNFCESFQKMTNEEIKVCEQKLSKWALQNQLTTFSRTEHLPKPKDVDRRQNKSRPKSSKKNETCKNETLEQQNFWDDVKSETTTASSKCKNPVLSDNVESFSKAVEVKMECDSPDPHPERSDVHTNNEGSPDPMLYSLPPEDHKNVLQEELEVNSYQDDVLMSIIEHRETVHKMPILDHESQVFQKKEELLSQISEDIPGTGSTSTVKQDSSEFLMSLVDPDPVVKESKLSLISNVEDILKEADLLLNQ